MACAGKPNTIMSNKKILLVEDDEMLLNILVDVFSKEQFTVLSARNGEEGLKQATEKVPDIILLDILMPKMDGIAMMKKIRENPKLKKTPAVILTNLNDTQAITQALETGAYDFLVKSDWEPKDLLKKIKEKLGMA